ncbi:uncharacterized protein [Haliotis asinina]|uniref:uncharacterized protein n=1 Tax=Haliotis asinina TaxID=109174 RepID=UPI00353235FA
MTFVHHSIERLFLLCVISCFVIIMCQDCFDDAIQHDKYMEHQVFRKFGSPSLYECVSECLTSSVCLSFAFQHKTQTCFLNNNSSSQVSISPRSGFHFSDIQQWTKALSGPCVVMSCPVATSCQVDRHGRATCAPEFSGCGFPPYVPWAIMTYDGHYKGAVARYTCKKDYIACHRRITSVCQASEQWNSVTGLCRKFRWKNPRVNGDYDLPCGPQSKFSILVLATPNSVKGFSLNTKADADVTFHARFGDGFLTDKIVINSMFRGRWGVEKFRGYKITVGKQSQMQVSLHNGVYELMVDNIVVKYRERQPGILPDTIRVEGDALVSLIQVSI